LKLLLDSHVLLWWSAGDRKLGARAAKILMASDNELLFSVASWWELGIKQVAGRLRFDMGFLREELRRRGVVELPVTFEHAEAARALPALHTDPFDHMLVAQAVCENCKLLTRDAKLAPYGLPVLRV
jgi:PIN domain nuclease of toxin-antitoxin system